ncbi:MAG: IS4 family transposase [Floccifex porci]|uniref:IS4 family transposase n=1 Tax=Floccifex porci TaxID=2606629 RepID=UPI003F127A9F
MSRGSAVSRAFTVIDHIFKDIDDHKNEYMAMEFVGKDYTRNRKLSMSSVLKSLFSFGCSSLHDEYNRLHVHHKIDTSLCAFVRARDKISLRGIKLILQKLNKKMSYDKTFKGYRLLAIDGSKVSIYPNKKDDEIEKRKSKGDGKPSSLIHVSALFDVLNKVFIDCRVNKESEADELRDATQFIKDNINDKNIFVCDRGYGGYNLFYNIMKTDQHFVIRIKDINSSTSISHRIKKIIKDLNEEFDETVTLTFSRKASTSPDVVVLSDKRREYDFFNDSKQGDIKMTLRFVRFRLEDAKEEDSYECLVTNLSEEEMSVSDLKEIYRLRWGIETGFMHLKYAIGLNRFHAKKLSEITKEVWMRLINYNLDSLIIMQIAESKRNRESKKKKYSYTICFSQAAYIIRDAYKTKVEDDLEKNIAAMVIPVKPDRHFDRNVRPHSYQTFCYRYS